MKLLRMFRALVATAMLLTLGTVAANEQAEAWVGLPHLQAGVHFVVPSFIASTFHTPPPPVDTSKKSGYRNLIVKNLGPVVNTDKFDFAPTITADGRTMYFVSRRAGGLGDDDFWVTRSEEGNDTVWGPPVNVGQINSDHGDGAASIAADGQTIYFASNRNTTVKGDMNLWSATLDGVNWKNVKEVGPPINTTYFESQPSISPDGKRLFFASNRPPNFPGDKGGKIAEDTKNNNLDIFVSHQLADGRWGDPVNLGHTINTAEYDGSPFIATDGTTLYFASQGHGSFGGLDIFRSEWKGPSDTDWTTPEQLPAPINTKYNDMVLTIPAAGNILFFTSDREGGSGGLDLYLATNPPPPKNTLVLRGICYDVNTKEKLGAHVVIRDEQTGDTVYNKFANSATGEYLAVLSSNAKGELGGSFLVSATEANHFPYPPTALRIPLRSDTSRIITHDIPMNNEEPPLVKWVTQTPELMKKYPDKFPKDFKGVIIEEQATIELFTLLPMVFFDQAIGTMPGRYVLYHTPAETQGFSEDTLSATLNAYYNYLNIIGLRMRNTPAASVTLTGCNSQDAANEKSLDLSRQRAESVKKYLVDIWGIQPNRISVEARNLPENPTLPSSPEGIAENRRVELACDSWEIIHPVLHKQNVKVPDFRNVKFHMVNGLREETIAKRELDISYMGKPYATLTELGALSATESPDWNWRAVAGSSFPTGKLPEGEDKMSVQLRLTDKAGREVLSNVDVVGVKQFSQSQRVADNVENKTVETYNLILFKYNTADMGKWNHKILDTYVYERIQPNSDVAVNGFTDILGTDDYNDRLSTNRANAVRGDVAQHRSKSASLVAKGYGKKGLPTTGPLYPNTVPEGRYYNRTVQVLVSTPIKNP
jgi:outer membrane protein OmpA-like peptidoglycan-associated protein/Tol biopolymer transport system component